MSTTVTPSSAVATVAEDLVLKVCGSSHNGQVVRLKSPKCTIGSGPRCTLRLRARGVRPIHCLVVRGTGSTVIRRWSPDTRLNGRTFCDAELLSGDRLSVGTIELEVLQPGRLPLPDPVEDRQVPFQPARSGQMPRPQVPEPSRWDRHRIDQLTARLKLANRQGRQRVRKLLEELRSARREVSRLRDAHQERSELERQLKEQAEALNARQRDLHLRREEFERERISWSAELGEAEEKLRQRGQELDADQAQLETRREEFQRGRQAAETEQAETSLPREEEEPPVETRQWQQGETREEEQAERAIDIADVFRRMSSRGPSLEEEQRHESASEPERQPPERPAAEGPSRASRVARGGGEESIEDYMSRLMERVHAIRGDSRRENYQQREPPPEEPLEPAVQDIAGTLQPEEPGVPRFVTPPPEPEEAAPDKTSAPQPQKEAPRAVAPEKRANLAAMRDLANLSAHSAIDRHARRQARFASCGKLLVVAVAVGAGTLLLRIWLTRETSDVTLYAAATSFLVALLWVVKCAGLAGRQRPCRSGRRGNKPDQDGEGKQAVDMVQREEEPGEQAQGEEVLYGSESDAQGGDLTEDFQHELKALIDAWPKE